MLNQDFKMELLVDDQQRIDKWIAQNSKFSRSDIQKLVKLGAVFVDKIKVRKTGFIVRPGQKISITAAVEKEIKANPEKISLDVIYEDKDIIIINKPSGMVVHPAPGHHSGTLVNALLYRFKDLSDISGKIRPGIVHRIDKDTSGLLVVAKNNDTHQKLAQELKEHKIKRTYLAWVEGRMENKITHINLPIGRDVKHRQKMAVTKTNAKDAVTHVYVEKILKNKSLVRCELETGRTHQIRVHLAYIKHPIIGDPVYGSYQSDFGQHLHAFALELIHPQTNKALKFKVKPPKEFLSNY